MVLSVIARSMHRLIHVNYYLDKPEQSYYVDTSTLHLQTNFWVAREMTGVAFYNKDGRFGCGGIGLGRISYEPTGIYQDQ